MTESTATANSKNTRSTKQATNKNGDDRPRTKEEIQKLFAWWAKEMESSPQKGTGDKPNDKALITMALGEQLPSPTKA